MKTSKILLLFSLLNCRGEAAPPSGLSSWLPKDGTNNKTPTWTPYLQTLAEYFKKDTFTLGEVLPIQPLIKSLVKKRGITDGHGQDPSEEVWWGNGHHLNNAVGTNVSNLLSPPKPKALDSPRFGIEPLASVAVNHGLMNEGAECLRACGRQSGFCPTFCGIGLCCRSGKVRKGCDGRMGKKDTYVCVRPPISAPSEGNPAIDHTIPSKPEPAPHTEALTQAQHTKGKQDAVTDIVSAVLETALDIPKHMETEIVGTALKIFNIFAG